MTTATTTEEIVNNHECNCEFEMKNAGQRILKVLNLVKEGDCSFEDGLSDIKKIAQELIGE